MPTFENRLTRVEARIDSMNKLITDNVRQNDHTNEILEEIQKKINTMQGFSAGVASVFGVIGAFLGLLWDKLFGH